MYITRCYASRQGVPTAMFLVNLFVHKMLGSRFAQTKQRFQDAMRFKMSGPNQFNIVPDSRLDVTRIIRRRTAVPSPSGPTSTIIII